MQIIWGAAFALIAYLSVGGQGGVTQNPATLELQTFLEEKGSSMPAEELIKYPNWKMIVALSAAESGYGKHLGGEYNSWGIKDFRSGSAKFGKTRDFESWEESIAYTSNLLYKYEPENGMPTAVGMVSTWKYVKPYGHWINNVNYSLYDIDQHITVEV
jgi:hypothetical protein